MLSRKLRNGYRDAVQFVSGTGFTSTTTASLPSSDANDVAIVVINQNPVPTTPSGWTLLETATNGAMYAKTSTGGSISIVFGVSCDAIAIALFRNCVIPPATNSESTYHGSIVDPDPPALGGGLSVIAKDMVITAASASCVSNALASVVPSGYTEMASVGSSTRLVAIGGATDFTSPQNPGVFDWNLSSGLASSFTLLLERS